MVASSVLENCEIALASLEEEIQELKNDLLNEQRRRPGMGMDSDSSQKILKEILWVNHEIERIQADY